ncbi:MAG: ankyrin repeat domain-containing protein [Tatlockia sp.]|nr:ankyrin repeat domain-containing protein [Tatlockia sp.]
MDKNQGLIEVAKSITPKIRYLKKLLSEGADINYKTKENGCTPLMLAVKGKHDRIADYLLRQGADPLIRNHENKIASEIVKSTDTIYPVLKDFELIFAVLNNDLLTAEAVIQSGALINFRDVNGYTSLMHAIENNFEEMVKLLLLKGADPALRLENGQSMFNLSDNQTIHIELENALSWAKGPSPTKEKKIHCFFTNHF